MVRVGGILDDVSPPAQAAFMVYVPNGGQLSAGDAVFTTRWSALQSDAEQLPYHTEIQLVSKLSIVRQ